MLAKADVVIKNCRLENIRSSGFRSEQAEVKNLCITYDRYEDTGPFSKKLGYVSVTGGHSGSSYMRGQPGKAPVRPNITRRLGGCNSRGPWLDFYYSRETFNELVHSTSRREKTSLPSENV